MAILAKTSGSLRISRLSARLACCDSVHVVAPGDKMMGKLADRATFVRSYVLSAIDPALATSLPGGMREICGNGSICGVLLAFCASCGSSSSTSVAAPTSTQCALTLSASTPMADATGANGTLQVTTNRECSWTARSDADWLRIASSTSGQGNGLVAYTVAPNGVVTERRGNLLVNDQALMVKQAGAPCVFALDRSERAFDASGGSQAVGVAAQSGCSWTAVSNAAWVAIASDASGSGNGSVMLVVDGNTGVNSRSAMVTIAGQTFRVDQSGKPAAPTPPPPPPAPAPTPPAPSPAPPPPSPAPPPPQPERPRPPPPPPEVLNLEGAASHVLGACPVLSFWVSGHEVHTLATTQFVRGACSKVKDDREVKVTGAVQAAGFVLATRVEFKKDD